MLFLVLVLGLACARKGLPEAPVRETERYHVALAASFDTEGTRGDGSAIEALAPLDGVQRQLDFVVEIGFMRDFRDGSEGNLVLFERAAEVTEEGSEPLALEGRSVELRRFADREILDIDLFGHIVGGDRQAEVFDLLFPALSPAPPDLAEGARARRTARWPTRWGHKLGWWNTATITWTHEGMVDRQGIRAFQLSYEGPWEVAPVRVSMDASGPHHADLGRAQGTCSGVAWFAKDDLSLLAHDFSWERTVTRSFSGAPGGEATVVQVQRFEGSLERLP